MSQPDPKEGGRSPASPLQSVPEDESTPPTTPDLQRTGSAPVVFTDSFSPANQDGKRAVITSPAASPEIRRPSEPPRRQSLIRFNTSTAEDTIRRESVAAGKMPTADAKRMSVGERRQSEGGADAGRGRRMSSPPPKSSYQRGVSFDTFDNRDATDFSLTLNYKHRNHKNTRRSRTFLCGTDQNEYSEYALEWLLDELIDDNDEIVCFWVVEKDSKIASESSVQQKKYQQEAQKLMDWVISKNSQEGGRAISLILELAVGKVQDVIQRMIQIYEPASLVVGTRGRNRGGMQGLLSGSVSKYCLQESPVPVIVVPSTTSRMKKKKKRLADPNRRNYNSILEKTKGGYSLDKGNRNSVVGPLPSSTDEEAAAVARAIGVPKHFEAMPLPRMISSRSNSVERSGSPMPLSLGSSNRVMKSPSLGPIDTPENSDDDSDDSGQHLSPKIKKRAGKAKGIVVDEIDPSKDPPWLSAILESDTRKV